MDAVLTSHIASDEPRVLVVDGSKVARRMIEQVLKSELPNAVVMSCENGAQAKQHLESGVVDLVTMALTLPDMGGFALWRGLVREIISLLGWVIAFLAASLFAGPLSVHMPDSVQTPELRAVGAFIVIFVAALVVTTLLGIVLSRQVDLLELAQRRTLDAGEPCDSHEAELGFRVGAPERPDRHGG